MTLTGAKIELKKFVRLKTTLEPAFVEVLTSDDVVIAKRGRWERKGYHLHCSCCDWSTDLATPYCPGCGAYLGGDAK